MDKRSHSNPGLTKWKRLFNAFAVHQNRTQDRRRILGFIRHAMKPDRYLLEPGRYEAMRQKVNRALSFSESAVEKTGQLVPPSTDETLGEAGRRAGAIR